ncbi:15159_t:CDS:1 [Acaulospora colombiana]|uniref:15159_t:CDS:1 n=1 Tax=Acaulospora colombiana TaxID=27376 RepID=A0ACA9M5L1_9GLOM|nr:15159_t:CDS:1 [Acaulospora colombiana]
MSCVIKAETVDNFNSINNIISTSNMSTTSSLSSSITEKSTSSESSDYSFSSFSPEDNLSQELSVSLQNLINHGEQEGIEFVPHDSFINSHANTINTMTLINNYEFSHYPPPLEFDVSPSDDQILSPEEFDAIFESFFAAADGRSDCNMISQDIDNPMFDLLESEQLTQALESFSII